MSFQMRMESNLRNASSKCCANAALKRKRKNSSFAVTQEVMRPEMGRNRSEAEEPVVEVLMEGDSGNHQMRSRAQLSFAPMEVV